VSGPRRVLIAQATAEGYGSDRSALLIARGLVSRGWEVTVALPERGSLAPLLEDAGARVVLADPGAPRLVFGPAAWLSFAARLPIAVVRHARLARRAEVVHANASTVLAAAVGARLARRPLVWHVRESYADNPRSWRLLAHVMRRLAAVVVANSEATGREAEAAGLGSRVVVVRNGIDLGPRREPGSGGAVVTVGRINGWKGQDVLVEATALLDQRGVAVDVEIAGDVYPGGEEHRLRLERLVRERGVSDHVRLLGYVDDVPRLLERAAVFVLPSKRPEPFGLALVEAMAAGVACVATDAGGPREIVRHGETGLLVPPGDPVALADALERLLREPELRRRLGSAAADDVRRRFAADRMVDEIEAVYRDVLAA
jgi:glycosyltransferase involved in cell wall biosynthesis